MQVSPGMTLPKPYEAETGQLKSRPHFVRLDFGVERHMRQAIQSNGEMDELFGVQYPIVVPDNGAFLEHLRSNLTAHFNDRVATPDAAVWQQFADVARAQLERHARLDDDTLQTLRATIDGL